MKILEQTLGPLETAVHLLAKRDYTEQELRTRLQRKKFSRDEVAATLETLKENGYLNDARVRQRTIEKMVAEKRHGLRWMIGKLQQMGLIVSTAEVRQYCTEEEEWEIADQLLQKHFPAMEPDKISRIARFLATRGFSAAVMNRAAAECRKHQS